MICPLLIAVGALGEHPTPLQLIHEAREVWVAENGRTWGKSLAGPLLIVDPKSHQVWASEADAEGKLKAAGDIFVGIREDAENASDTAQDWAGKRWSTIVIPLPDTSPAMRKALLLHESFHRIQPSLNLTANDAPNNHLDTFEGRIWLTLEWHALAKAFETKGEARRSWVFAALACRTQRQNLFPDAAETEHSLELAEGLAEYTGLHVVGARQVIIEKLRKAEGPFARSFAYTAGPAYGFLLDDKVPGWTRRVRRASDLSVLLQEAYQLATPSADEIAAAAKKLGEPDVRAHETVTEQARQERLAVALAPMTKGPFLQTPRISNLNFNPSNTESIDDVGVYHPTASYAGTWGRLTVTAGSLRAHDRAWAKVPAPADPKARPLSGPGWMLELSPGWTICAAQPTGSFVVNEGASCTPPTK